jgi:hypothetical protein
MPAAALFSLMWYGPGAGAMTRSAAASVSAGIKGFGGGELTESGAGSQVSALTGLKNSPLIAGGAGVVTSALPKARARPTVHVKVNELSQDDVAGAVLDAPIDGGLSLRELMRVMTSVIAGKSVVTDLGNGSTSIAFRDPSDTKDRTVATVDAFGNRSVSTLDTSP